MLKVFIIILTYNVKNDVLDCLKSIDGLSAGQYELHTVVVDNNSRDQTVDAVKKEFPDITIIANDKNLGYTGGNNIGIKYALNHHADYVLILNPDITVDSGLINELLVVSKAEKAGIVGPKIYFSKGAEYHKERYKTSDLGKVIWWAGGKLDWNNVMTIHRGVNEVDSGQFGTPERIDTVAGTVMFIKKEVFTKIGLFDNKYFLYFEESDFCQRAVKSGFELWYAPQARAWHRNAISAGIGSGLQDYFTTRNRLLFGLRYAPIRSKLALFRQSVSLLISGRPWQKKGVLDFYLGHFGQGSYQS